MLILTIFFSRILPKLLKFHEKNMERLKPLWFDRKPDMTFKNLKSSNWVFSSIWLISVAYLPNCKSGYVYKDASNAPPPSSSNLSFHSFPIDPGVRQNICYKPCFHLTNILSMSFVTTINFCFYFKCAFVIMLMTRPTISLIFAWKKHFFSHY